jgi:tellurite resistance protein TerA
VTRQGCYDQAPYIWHQGDDRGDGASSGETIFVNPQGVNEIRRMTIYTFIFEGAAKWSETNAVVRVKVPGQEDVIVEMGEQASNKRMFVIAELYFGGDDSITVKKCVTFHDRHSECDGPYGWGFKYQSGSKD